MPAPDYDPSLVHVVLERCPRCGELAPTSMSLGEAPTVNVRWRFRKSDRCDHLLVDRFEVVSR